MLKTSETAKRCHYWSRVLSSPYLAVLRTVISYPIHPTSHIPPPSVKMMRYNALAIGGTVTSPVGNRLVRKLSLINYENRLKADLIHVYSGKLRVTCRHINVYTFLSSLLALNAYSFAPSIWIFQGFASNCRSQFSLLRLAPSKFKGLIRFWASFSFMKSYFYRVMFTAFATFKLSSRRQDSC